MPNNPNIAEPDKNLLAKWLGGIGAALCGLLVLAIAFNTVANLNLRPGDVGGSMGSGMLMILFIPVVSIPVILFCVAAAIFSARALRKHPSPAAQAGLSLSVWGPIVLLVCYGACFAIMLCFGH